MSLDKEMKDAVMTVAKARVAEALGGDVLGRLVDEVLKHANRSGYSNAGNTKTFLDEIVAEQIRRAVEHEVRELIANSPDVKERMRAAIHERADAFAMSVVDAFVTDSWQATVNVDLGHK